MVCLFLRPPELETDLRNVQPARSEAVLTEERIHEVFGGGGEPVLILVEASAGRASPDPEIAALDSAARLEGELTRLLDRGVIAAWSSPARLVPSVGEGRAVLSILERKDPASIEAAFRSALEEEGFDPSRFEAAAGTLRRALSRREPITPADLRRAGLEAELDRMLGAAGGKGYALVAVHPTGEMWTAAGQKVVFDALERAVDAARVKGGLAGAHVVSARSAEAVLRELAAATAVACLAVVILVASLFRGIAHAALALLPVTLGTLVTAALCGLLGYKLNFMNAGILPMIVGIGVDDGIHMVKQYLDQPHPSAALVVRSTGAAVMLTSITTLAAFGTMAFSVNRGLASVGVISAIGVTACLFASIVTLPAALELHSRRGR
jgi:predicted RND superfamily exporter protein